MSQVYEMTNSTMTGGFRELSPVVNDMESAVVYFRKNYAVEFPGSVIKQIEGVNPVHGPSFSANAVWATPEEADAFNAKYGYVPLMWYIHTEAEQEAMMQAEWAKEERKAMFK